MSKGLRYKRIKLIALSAALLVCAALVSSIYWFLSGLNSPPDVATVVINAESTCLFVVRVDDEAPLPLQTDSGYVINLKANETAWYSRPVFERFVEFQVVTPSGTPVPQTLTNQSIVADDQLAFRHVGHIGMANIFCYGTKADLIYYIKNLTKIHHDIQQVSYSD